MTQQQPRESLRSRVVGQPTVIICALILFQSVLLGACEDPGGAIERVEERLKAHSEPRGKAGMLRSLQVAQSAQKVAREIEAAPRLECELQPPGNGAYTYEWRLELRRDQPGTESLHWREERSTRRDSDGNLSVASAAGVGAESEGERRRDMSWRIFEEDAYVSFDGVGFRRQPPGREAHERLEAVGLGTAQALLDSSSGGWRRVSGDAIRFEPGGERLICGPSDRLEAGWLRRLAAHAAVIDGHLEASSERVGGDGSARSRRIRMQWQLDDGQRLHADFEDQLSLEAADITAPPADQVVEKRDRSLAELDSLLEEFASPGEVEVLRRRESKNSPSSTGDDHESQ